MALKKWILDHKFLSAFLAVASIHIGIYSLQKLAKAKKPPERLSLVIEDSPERASGRSW